MEMSAEIPAALQVVNDRDKPPRATDLRGNDLIAAFSRMEARCDGAGCGNAIRADFHFPPKAVITRPSLRKYWHLACFSLSYPGH